MKGKTIIAVDLGGTNVRTGKVQEHRILKSHSRPIPGHGSEEAVFDEIVEEVRRLFDDEVVAIGIGVPSVVDVEKGIVFNVHNIPSWKEVPLKEKLENIFSVPVYVNNDANCFVLGELHFGKGKGFRNVTGLTLGTGLGGGVVIDGKLYSGTNCGAGEIGMIPYKNQILEYYCSGSFFTREFGVSGEIVFQRAREGDLAAVSAYNKFGTEMALAICIVLYAYDPQLIILGGSVSKAFSLFQTAMMSRLKELFSYHHVLERLKIEISELPDVALLGGAALYLDALKKHQSPIHPAK